MDSVTRIPVVDFGALATDLKSELSQFLKSDGGLVLRGYAGDLESFESLTKLLCTSFHRVGTREDFKQDRGDGFTTTVYPDNFILLGHSEGTYRPVPAPPDMCFFMCITPPDASGGETTVIDGRKMFELIPEEIRTRLLEQGMIYESEWAESRWKVEFNVETAEDLKVKLDTIASIEYELNDSMLTYRYHAPAILQTNDGHSVFANGLLAHLNEIEHPTYKDLPAYSNPANRVYFGNGEEMDNASINALIDAHDTCCYKHDWQLNDILVLDNARLMHGRAMCSYDCERVILSRFGSKHHL